MDKQSCDQDILGNKFGEHYSLVLTDHCFENALKAFDPNLKLMFDQVTKRWTVLVWREDNSGWQILMRCEDDFGNPMPLGEHIFEHLKWMRDQYEVKANNPDGFFDNLMNQADDYKRQKEKELSEEAQYRIRHDINSWRRALAEATKGNGADATAGFQYQPQKKDKGTICL